MYNKNLYDENQMTDFKGFQIQTPNDQLQKQANPPPHHDTKHILVALHYTISLCVAEWSLFLLFSVGVHGILTVDDVW